MFKNNTLIPQHFHCFLNRQVVISHGLSIDSTLLFTIDNLAPQDFMGKILSRLIRVHQNLNAKEIWVILLSFWPLAKHKGRSVSRKGDILGLNPEP